MGCYRALLKVCYRPLFQRSKMVMQMQLLRAGSRAHHVYNTQ